MHCSAVLTAITTLALALPAWAAEMGHHGAMALSTGEPREAVIDFSPDPAPGAKLVTDFPAGLIYVVRSGGGEIYKHVNSSFRVKDPSGNIMVESESVHSHTGVFNIMQSFASPGIYTLEVEAGSMYPGTFSPVRETFDFEVSDPGELGNAALEVSTEGFIANKLTEITIAVSDPASGEGLKHSSFNVLVLRMGQRLLQTRLHTHTGVATFRYRFPSAGSYVIEVTALPTPGDTQYNYPATNIRKTVTVADPGNRQVFAGVCRFHRSSEKRHGSVCLSVQYQGLMS